MKRTFTTILLILALAQSISHSQTPSGAVICKVPWIIVSPPNPEISGSTIAVVSTESNLSETRAAAMASFLSIQFNSKSRWKQLDIYVFKDKKAAQTFATYQAKRQQQILKSQDYRNLASLWPHTLIRYSHIPNHKTRLNYPAKNPTTWWIK